MSDYPLHRLNDREFEHLTSALGLKVLGPGLRPFGDGRDGGREATFDGEVNYPDPVPASGKWNGYGIVQAKFNVRPKEPAQNASWLLRQIKNEIDKWKDKKEKRHSTSGFPKYFLFTTNVILSAVEGVGGVDRIEAYLESELPKIGVQGWDFWDHEKICRFLDTYSDIRAAYSGFLTSGDLIAHLIESIDGATPDLTAIYETHTINALRRDQWIRLGESGGEAGQKLSLARVAVDLPIEDKERRPDIETLHEARSYGALVNVIKCGDRVLRPDGHREGAPHVVVLGGPGQGKSTLTQLLAQIYRLEFLREHPPELLGPEEAKVQRTLTQHLFEDLGIPRPSNRRWPFVVKLSEFGDRITGGEDVSLLRFISEKIEEHHAIPGEVTPLRLRQWLQRWPWIIILDGLDEVPSRSVRADVFDKVADFLSDARQVGADLFVVATTRPQGYDDELSTDLYRHLRLAELNSGEALSYVRQLASVQHHDDDDLRKQILQQAKEAVRNDATSKLMVTPLQLTIMSLLLAKRARLPETRHELFSSYFSTIYAREENKPHSHLARLLGEYKNHVEYVHAFAGMRLHQIAESVGHADALLTHEEFKEIIHTRLRDEEEFSERDVRDVQDNLTAAAMDRLVLLVPRAAGHVGFELRSLQEFMAGTFFFRYGESRALEPFQATAHSAHWRNTWLLAAGRLFAKHETLRSELISLVRDIGLQSQVRRACQIGPLLALDLLSDDAARRTPKYRRQLVQIALDLLKSPPGLHSAAFATVIGEAVVRDDEVHSLVRQSISESINSTGNARIAAIVLLAHWRQGADRLRAIVKLHLDPALRKLDPQSGAALQYFCEGHTILRDIGKWGQVAVDFAGQTTLADVVQPYLKSSLIKDSAAKRSLLRVLRPIKIQIYSLRGQEITAGIEGGETSQISTLLDYLAGDTLAQELLAEAVCQFEVKDMDAADFLRTQLRRSIDRIPPEWNGPWDVTKPLGRAADQ